MTRTEHYLAGKAEGERWAEEDLRAGLGLHHDMTAGLRANARIDQGAACRATALGRARGYRLTVARFEAGELTFEMFEHGPVGR